MAVNLSDDQKKLMSALNRCRSSNTMINNAIDGLYDDYLSLEVNPIMALVQHANRENLKGIVKMAKLGEFDGTKDDSERWAASKDGQDTFKELLEGR